MGPPQFDMVIDATGLRLGRMASYVAKNLLQGRRIAIINCEKAVISGSKKDILEKYLKRLEIRGQSRPEKGPKHVRRPDRIVWYAIRGMLPIQKYKGRQALRRLRVYIGTPDWATNIDKITIPEFHVDRLKGKYIPRYVTVGWISYQLGYSCLLYTSPSPRDRG